MLKAIIIDDELLARKMLKNNLDGFCPNVELIGEGENVKSGIELINSCNPDLVFLDIMMPDGTGFDLLDKFISSGKSINFKLIFTSTYDKFALKAIKFSALDYLLKPVEPAELVAAVDKATLNISNSISMKSIEALLNNTKQPKPNKNIVLASADSITLYRIDEIIRCESERNYTKFYFVNDKPLLVSRTLKEFDDMLSDSGFERIHNSHLVNVNFIKKYVKSDGGYIIMKDGSNVPISRSKRDSIMDILSSQ